MKSGCRYTIGLDLGTTNCALAWVDSLDKDPSPAVLSIPQIGSNFSVDSSLTLPSVLYCLTEAECSALDCREDLRPLLLESRFICGRMALDRAGSTPGRVVSSAKSWFIYGQADRHDAVLPWQSEDVPASEKISPLHAASLLLRFLRDSWDREIALGKQEYSLSEQSVIITVPASFDEAAQRLSLEAAALAGFPASVRLLEEPQAAFYAFLGSHPGALDVLSELPSDVPHILVVDVGGGTTDFSLFSFDQTAADPVRRVSVSDHILLGGDNIDLAVALLLENRSGMRLSRSQKQHLFFQSRWLKEKVLNGKEPPTDDQLTVSIPGEGSSLFSSSVSIRVTAAEVIDVLAGGFFPDVPADAAPCLPTIGLRESGLPYAADTAVTRHLAGFLRGRQVDAVLYNGGTMEAPLFRELLNSQLQRWQNGRPVVELENTDRALAVARGAAEYGCRLSAGRSRISGGYPRNVYLEVASRSVQRQAVCVVPKGLETGFEVVIETHPFEVIVGEPVRFQAYAGSSLPRQEPGTLVSVDLNAMHPLPPLETFLDVQRGLPRGALRVSLESAISELGILRLFCVHKARSGQTARWELQFNLRQKAESLPAEEEESRSAIDADRLRSAGERILEYYGRSRSGIEPSPPGKLIRELETILGRPRDQWDLAALRALWPSLLPGLTRRGRSLMHETVWFQLAGYILRPGCGFPLDTMRISELWRLFSLGRHFKKDPNSRIQWWIMWRRLAGGLDRIQQESLFEQESRDLALKKGDEGELIRLLASLERVNQEMKKGFGEKLCGVVSGRGSPLKDHAVWAMGRIGSRSLLYAGRHNVLPAESVIPWIEHLLDLLEDPERRLPAVNALVQIARLSGDSLYDISEQTREQVAGAIQRFGHDPLKAEPFRVFVPMDESARNQLFGEALPLGLRFERAIPPQTQSTDSPISHS